MASMQRTAPAIEDLEALRGPLTGYCYRMLGCAADTDDAVQETVIRAYRHLDRFDPARGGLSTWMHGIATNICLDMLRGAKRRALLAPVPPSTPGGELGAPAAAERWLEPMPDSRTIHPADPADLAVQRDSVRLAFLASLQYLPPRQRAVLLLRDVYGFSALETARALEITRAAANSALQRARSTLAARRLTPSDVATSDDHQELLDRYIAAFEAHDVKAMRDLLRSDVVASMPPFEWWLSGRNDLAAVFAASDACATDRLLPLRVNGTIGYGQYRPGSDGKLRPFAVVALDVRDRLVVHTITFLGTGTRFSEFGLAQTLPLHR
ncbi:MAG: RNA polymerase subunit sigma-70 [Actinomycetota bacterium]